MLCQSIKREQWVDKLNNRLLHVPYVHMIFTLPHSFNGLCRNNQMAMYNLVLISAWQTVKEIFKIHDTNPGMSSVLHTFGSDMKYHIHVHALVTYGGLNNYNEWVYPNVKYGIERYRKVCAIWKTIVLKNIKALYVNNKLNYHEDFETISSTTEKIRWVVHSTRPTANTATIEKYLAKYINRIGVSDNRVQYLKEQSQVILQYNDYKHQLKNNVAPKAYNTMEPLVFIHQLLQHVLPSHFQKSRNYGLHKLSEKQKEKIHQSLIRNANTIRSLFQIISHLLGLDALSCSICGQQDFEKEEIQPNRKWILKYISLYPKSRSPPTCNQHIHHLNIITSSQVDAELYCLISKNNAHF